MMLWKSCTQYASKFGILSSGHRTGKGSFHSNPKERAMPKNVQRMFSTIAVISHTSKIMLKILQARLQQYLNCGLPDVQAGFRKGRGTRDWIDSIRWITEKAREFQKNNYFCFTDYAKAFDCVDHNKLWKILKQVGIPDYLTCLLRNLYAGQEAIVVHQGCILSPCLFNLYEEYTVWNAGLDEAQAGIKIVSRNINNFRYADDITLMAESEEEVCSGHWWWTGGLACCSPWGRKESDMTEWWNWTELNTVKGFGVINKAEVDVFLEFSCFFCDPTYVGNLVSSSSVISC